MDEMKEFRELIENQIHIKIIRNVKKERNELKSKKTFTEWPTL